jgi:membrane complex biogenesis BtpA family protein
MTWLTELFVAPKPVIGMCHLPALPGDPAYDLKGGGMRAIVESAKREVDALQRGGVHGLLISNEFSLPYLTKTEPITATCMAAIVGELRRELSVPFGINVLWDAVASIDVAAATGAAFVREIFTGVYASDFGLWDTNCGATARHRARIGAGDVRLLFNIVPEAAAYLGGRDLESVARSTVFNARPDGLCVSGLTAGSATDTDALRIVKRAAGDTPVVVNTGVNTGNIAEQLEIADAAIVGTALKRDGHFYNAADTTRVARLMAAIPDAHAALPA